MPIQLALTHRTQYRYDNLVTLGPQLIRLRPAPHVRTKIVSYSLTLGPAKHRIHWQQDAHSNWVARALVLEKATEFNVDVDLVAELAPFNPFDFLLEPAVEEFPFQYPSDLLKDLSPYLEIEPAGPLFQAFADEVSREPRPMIGFLVDLNHRVRDTVGYVTRMETGIQTCEETLQFRTGSCRDSAWFLAQLLRRLGFAARFVSGYLIQLTSEDPPSGETSSGDTADLHAWTEVFLPGAGWVGLDPTSGLLAGEGHIPLACTPGPSSAAPVTGSVAPANVDFSFSFSIARINEAPRSSAPLTEKAWADVERVAEKVDRDLEEMDVRLTMGGEPTFVGIDEPDSPQWNGDAMGPLKRNRAIQLITRLRDQIAPGALLHFGQGKWYPGEPLPRWALTCYWRSDKVPIWQKPELIADEGKDYGFTTLDALRFMEALTKRLQVSAANIIPAYEDHLYYLWKERRLPINVDPSDSKLMSAREREELARVFERGLAEPVGYVLPIRRRQHHGTRYWSSQLWFFRPERLLLLQGDSPVGFRLPLDSLPWVTPDDIEYEYEADPFSNLERLPPLRPSLLHLFESEAPADPQPADPVTENSEKQVIRPALSVEARDGRLHVFLPYTTKLVDYLDLVAAIEDTSLYLQKPVWIEGYAPPSDPRLHSFSITPDPGVIEVNLPPAGNWEELKRINSVVFEEARSARLTAEKFAYDGSHTATGGGNHIVIGGSTPNDSPLLRRPDLLRSMVSFWQHHPSLSYLFSGKFIGPTSQHPRIDEARMDSLYELEIAFSQLPKTECPPWLVDRLFRNLLVDMTGNTHRAEFCIDKLYPPQGSRLGLLELRAFEMAPHLRMGLAQLLLIRALVAMFWKKPYEGRLVRWGTALHDRFLLPHFVKQDFSEVIAILQASGYAFTMEWFNAQFDFRFPKLGQTVVDGLEIELRQALEPWHVLGEEASSGGTVRNVDSSLERLQVKISGLTSDSRYVVTCNGRKAPLHPTGVPGEAVGGVRYRAWQPPICLHPTIPIHTPLVFDIVDLWSQRSIGGCTYHVIHPGGRWYAARPINAAEAESRRLERFQPFGHTSGEMIVAEEERNPSFPMTLDLRWPTETRKSSLGVPTPAAPLISP